MRLNRRAFIVAGFIFAGAPLFVEAAQIALDPNPIGSTIVNTVTNASMTLQRDLAVSGRLINTGSIDCVIFPQTAGLTTTGNLQRSASPLFRFSGLVTGQFDVLNIKGNTFFNGGRAACMFLNPTPMIGYFTHLQITGWEFLVLLILGLTSIITFWLDFHNRRLTGNGWLT
jgi:hypothetical protein